MKIGNDEKIIAKFGYWPKFCDAKIISLNFNFKSMEVELTIHYIDSDRDVQSIIKFHFSQVSQYNLGDIMEDNVLDELSIRKSGAGSIEVILDSCYGLNGNFLCKSAQVLALT